MVATAGIWRTARHLATDTASCLRAELAARTVVTGHHYLVTVPSIPAVVSLDVSDPTRPREVGRATLAPGDVPHWISLEPNTKRVEVTGYGALSHRVLLLTFDSNTGALAIDPRFHDEGASESGMRIDGVPHGAVFSRPSGGR